MSKADFILDFEKQDYPYLEEINEGILKQISVATHQENILDVGAGTGVLGNQLRNLGYTVYAIESDKKAAEIANLRLNFVINADLHDINFVETHLRNTKFKFIIFSDILEHVYDPLLVLRQYLPFLDSDGKILISLPNVVNWQNRLRFMFGSFNYEMTGVMDRTHIRFFTHKSAKKMLQACQCKIVKTDHTPYIIRAFLPLIKRCFKKNTEGDPAILIQSSYYRFYQKWIYPIEYRITRIFPGLLSFRMIFVVKRNELN